MAQIGVRCVAGPCLNDGPPKPVVWSRLCIKRHSVAGAEFGNARLRLW